MKKTMATWMAPSLAFVLMTLSAGCGGGGGGGETPVVGGPTPGPIIDIGGNGATIVVQVSGSSLPINNPTTDTLDSRFFYKTNAVGLVDCNSPDVNYLGKNKTLSLFHQNGTDKVVIKRNSDSTLSWSCVSGGSLTTISAGSDGDIPECLALAVGPTYKLESGETGHVVVFQTLEPAQQ